MRELLTGELGAGEEFDGTQRLMSMVGSMLQGGDISYNYYTEGLVGPQGPPGRDGRDGIIHITGLYPPLNSNFLTELPHNIDQINSLGTAADKFVFTETWNIYTDIEWTERQPAGDTNKNWRGVASDGDGSNLIAADYGGRLWTSDDSGATWTERRPHGLDENRNWLCVASDSDGSHLIAGIYMGRLYTSADSGVTWTERKPAGESYENWRGVASDADGSHLIAVTFGDKYYLSSNYGVDWTTKGTGFWQSTASDNDGSNLILSTSKRLFTSSNSGVDWTQRQPAGDVDKDWECIGSDSDGSNLLAGVKDGRLYTSINSGEDWAEKTPAGETNKNWFCGASDSDGSHLIVGESSGRLYSSADAGESWEEEQPAGNTSKNWVSVAIDSDGSNLIAASYAGRLYTGVITELYSEATWGEADLTSAGRALLDDADAAAQATTLGLVIGSDVQAHGDILDDLNALGEVGSDGEFLVGTAKGAFSWESGDVARTSIGLGTESIPQFSGCNLGTGELTCGSINRAADTLTLEVGGTAEISITSTAVTLGGNLIIPNGGTIGSVGDTDVMTIDASGNTTFSVFPITPSAAPDTDYEVANKKYVDDNAGSAFSSRCSVYRSTAQTITTSTYTKVAFANRKYDNDDEYDWQTNYRFQPNVNGYYHINSVAEINAVANGSYVVIAIYKNGTGWYYSKLTMGATTGAFPIISADMYLLSTDFIEIFVWHNHGSDRNIPGTGERTFMTIHRFA